MRWFFVFTAVTAALVLSVLLLGLFLPRLHAVAVSIRIPVGAAQLWLLLSDPRTHPEWRPGVDAVEILESDGEKSTRWREKAVTGESTWELTEGKPQRRIAARMVEHDLPFLRSWTWELEAEGEETRVVLTEEGETRHPFYRVLLRFVVGHRSAISEAARGLRDHAVSGT